MKLIYKAVSRNGEETNGFIIAKTKEAALKQLQKQGYAGIKLQLDIKTYIEDFLGAGFGVISSVEKVMFTKRLSVMIKADLPLDQSIMILKEQSESSKLRKMLATILSDIENGKPFSEGLARFPKVFDALYVNIIAAGEKAGRLQQSLENLSKQMAKTYELKQKVKSALFYPVLVIVLTVAIGLFLSTFILPKITKLFDSFDVQLPLVTRILIASANFLETNGVFVFIGIFVLIFAFGWMMKVKTFKRNIHRLVLRSPIFGSLISDFNMGLFSRTLGTLMTSGVPIVEALHITSNTFMNLVYRESLQICEEDVQKGSALSLALQRFPHIYPPLVFRMLAIGEETGKMEDVLFYLADFYEAEVDHKTQNLSTVIEPLLLVFIGICVAIVALAIILPIYQITGSFRR